MFSDKMIKNFDIDFVVSNFQVTNLKYYLDLLRKASNGDLRHLRQEVKSHKKHNRQHQAFTNVKKFSTHDAIIAAINHEILKRSFCYPLYKFLLRLRAPLVKTFTGLELKEDEYFGSLYTQPKHIRHYYLHMPHNEFLSLIGHFIVNNWYKLLMAFAALIGAVVTLLAALK